MAIIKDYEFADGHMENIEVTDEFAYKYEKMEKREKYINWRERQLHPIHIDALDPEQQDAEDPVHRNPEELILRQEREEVLNRLEERRRELPILNCLTDYQKRVAIKHYIEHKSQVQIAKEEGVDKSAINRLMKKIQGKIAKSSARKLSQD